MVDPGAHRCAGFPEGHECMADIPVDDIWCRSCRTRRQAELVAGIGPMVHVGIVLVDFDDPRPMCKCGGDATSADHEHSLLHRRWVWAESAANQAVESDPATLAWLRGAKQ
jgi:hypothetical protein